MSYEVIISRQAGKDIKALPAQEIPKVISKIEELGDQPHPNGCKKLAGSKENLWRIRSGDYHIIYSIETLVKIVDVRRVGHRKDIYKG